MRRFLFIVLITHFFATEAKSKNKDIFLNINQTSFVNFGFHQPNLQKSKIGLPSFSYASSLEQRFTLKNKLKFSLQYSLVYFHLNMNKLQQTIAQNTKVKELSAGVGIQAILQFRKDACVVTGFNLNKPIYSCFKTNLPSEVPNKSISSTQQRFSVQDLNSWNPMFNIGFEKKFNLFNRNLHYTFQYQFGYRFNKYNPNLVSKDHSNYLHGISVGLKYKL